VKLPRITPYLREHIFGSEDEAGLCKEEVFTHRKWCAYYVQ